MHSGRDQVQLLVLLERKLEKKKKPFKHFWWRTQNWNMISHHRTLPHNVISLVIIQYSVVTGKKFLRTKTKWMQWMDGHCVKIVLGVKYGSDYSGLYTSENKWIKLSIWCTAKAHPMFVWVWWLEKTLHKTNLSLIHSAENVPHVFQLIIFSSSHPRAIAVRMVFVQNKGNPYNMLT